MLNARSIGYGDPASGGPSGIYFAGLMDKLGIGTETKTKTKLYPVGGAAVDAVAKGEVDIAFSPASDLVATPGADLIPLPAELQSYTRYAAGVVATSKEPHAAKAVVDFLASPAAQGSWKAKGFEPVQ